MKKLLGILVLSLLWCNVGFALPECKGKTYALWNDCVGSAKVPNSKAVYTGSWKKGKPEGKGSLRWPDGEHFKGDFKNGYMDGFGTYHFNDGRIYVGEIKKDERHGQGTTSWPDGEKYEGEYKNDQMHGYGILIVPGDDKNKGYKYEGEFKNDLPHGNGKYFFIDGRVFEVKMRNGERIYTKQIK